MVTCGHWATHGIAGTERLEVTDRQLKRRNRGSGNIEEVLEQENWKYKRSWSKSHVIELKCFKADVIDVVGKAQSVGG